MKTEEYTANGGSMKNSAEISQSYMTFNRDKTFKESEKSERNARDSDFNKSNDDKENFQRDVPQKETFMSYNNPDLDIVFERGYFSFLIIINKKLIYIYIYI